MKVPNFKLSERRKYLFLVLLILLLLGWVINNNSQKLPEPEQVNRPFGPNSPYQFQKYEVKGEIPYITFLDTSNNRQCKVDLIKDYKLGFFNGNWIFGQNWNCSD